MQSSDHSGPRTEKKTLIHPEEELSFQESLEKFIKSKQSYENSVRMLKEEFASIEEEVKKFEEESMVEQKLFIEQKNSVMSALRAQDIEIKQLVQGIKQELNERFQ